ncbi:hypothetical protein JXJ21_20845 [candidate division KSB1 bacterium]|nr:hypothetical protein [candidate division KSB1 bacterium]
MAAQSKSFFHKLIRFRRTWALEIIVVALLFVALYIVFTQHRQNVKFKNILSARNERELYSQFLGQSDANALYILTDKKLYFIQPDDSFSISRPLKRSIEKAVLSNDRSQIACIYNFNLFVLATGDCSWTPISTPDTWNTSNLTMSEKSLIVWSPHDDKIAFTAFDKHHFSFLFVIELDSGKNFQLTEDYSIILDVAWISDDRLIFSALKNGTEKIYRVKYDGGAKFMID